MVTIDQVNIWLQEPKETRTLEFKEAKNQQSERKLFEYCVAIANDGGGSLVLGITDDFPRKVVGTNAYPDIHGIETKVFSCLNFRVNVSEVDHPDGRVVTFSIPPRPQGVPYHINGKYMMRAGSSLVCMSQDALKAIFDEGSLDWLEKASVSKKSEQFIIDCLDTQTFFELLDQPYPATRGDVIKKLIKEGLVEKDLEGYTIKRMGALLLARRLEDFPDISRKAPRVIVYTGQDKFNTRLDHVSSKGYAVGFQSLVNLVMEQIPQNEQIADALRREQKLLPMEIFRELIANALIHQDFDVNGTTVTIEIYSNRVEISNPGIPLTAVDRFIDENKTRNERLANLMRRMHICEEKGSGIDRVVRALEVFQLPPYDIHLVSDRTYISIYDYRIFEDMTKEDRMHACYQHCVLKYVMRDRMTNQSLRDRFKLPINKSTVITQIIALAQTTKLIKLDEKAGGSRKYAKYLPYWG